MQNTMIYPASISCEIVPEYENTFSKSQYDYRVSNFNILSGGDEGDEDDDDE